MTVKVELCWSSSKFYYRLSYGNKRCFLTVTDDKADWTREKASEALDLCQIEFGIRRQNIRFQHC